MITGPEAELREISHSRRCGECGGRLSMPWGGAYGVDGWVVVCTRDINHSTFKTVRETRKLLDPNTGYVEVDILTQQPVDDIKALAVPTSREGMLDHFQKAAKRGMFPQHLNAEMRAQLMDVALAYGLDPLFGELIIYQDKPYVTIQGRRRKDAEAGNQVSMTFRPLNAEEKAFYLECDAMAEGDLIMIGTVRNANNPGHFVEVMGRVLKSETGGSPHLPINKWRLEMCQKRIEMRGRSQLFGPIANPRREELPYGVTVEGEIVREDGWQPEDETPYQPDAQLELG